MDKQNKNNAYKKSSFKKRRSFPKRKRMRVQSALKSDEKIEIRCSFDASHSSVANLSFDKNLLSNWSFPPKIHKYYASKGINKLFDWQVECLNLEGVLDGKNLVYSAPTSAGKSMVADILLFKKLLEHKKKAIIILPFVSVTQEKMLSLKQVLRYVGVRVDAFAGGINPRGGLARVDVAVCTIEKANNMINKLIEDNKLQEIGLIVVDELHMIGNAGRGFLLELLLTKVLYMKNKINHKIQIVGMSATIPNLSEIAKWLDASLYVTDYRPVPLYERAAIGDVIYNSSDMTEFRSLDIKDYGIKKSETTDDSNLIFLAIETLVNGFGSLIFCATKAQCEKMCRILATNIYEFGKGSKPKNEATAHFRCKILAALNYNQITEVLQQLERCPAGLDPSIAANLRFGVAFHHAGLSMDERSIIEQAFRNGIIKVLCATSTLSAGVNLPARLVIIRSPLDFRGSVMDSMTYRQMIGRAGRQGVDTMGESILICSEVNRSKAEELLNSSLSPVNSCLLGSESSDTQTINSSHSFGGIKRAVLEIIANGTALNYDDVSEYMSNTLLVTNSTNVMTKTIIDDIIQYLVDEKLIHSMTDTDSQQQKITPTQFGKAVLASGISPKDGSFILSELNKAKASLCLYNDLHLLYEVTPINLSDQLDSIDWQHFLTVWNQMDEHMIKVGRLVGVSENSLFSLIRKSRVFKEDELLIHKRFYAALALNDLVREVPLQKVSSKFKCNKGVLQSLQQSASSFAGMLTTFCNRLGWHNLEILIDQFQSRLYFGVQRELIDLMRITSLNASVARLLYDAKYDTVVSLANVEKCSDIELVLLNSGPFDKNKAVDTSVMWVPGLSKAMSVREMAKAIIYESKELVNKDLGIKVYDLSQVSSTESNDGPNEDMVDLSDDSNDIQTNDIYTKIKSKETSDFSDELKENSQELSFMDDLSFDCDNGSDSGTQSTVVPTTAHTSYNAKSDVNTPGISSAVSSTPIPSTSTRSSLKHRIDKSIDKNIAKDIKDDSFGFGDSLDNISWDRLNDDLSKINESHKELADTSVQNMSTISTDLLTNRCVSPDLIRDSDTFSSRSEGSSKRSSSPSPSGKMGERVSKRPHSSSSISLINSDDSLLTEESSSDSILRSYSNDETTDSSVFQKTTFDELRIGDKFKILTIDSNNDSFNQLIDGLIKKFDHKKTFSLSFKTEKKNEVPIKVIGSKIRSLKSTPQDPKGLDMRYNNILVTALSICFESEKTVYYIQTHKALLKFKDQLKNKLSSELKIIAFDSKSCYKILRKCFECDVQTLKQIDWYDLRIGHWILDPEADRPKDVQYLVNFHAKSYLHLYNSKNSSIETECISTGLIFPVINILINELSKKSQLKAFKRIEIPSRFEIADLELNGMFVNIDHMNHELNLLMETKQQLEEKAAEVSNVKFKLSKPKEIAKVLYEDLNLLSNYYSVQKNTKPNTKGNYGRKLPKHLSTSKSSLKKLMSLTKNPLPRIILDWRRVNYAIKDSINPVISGSTFDPTAGLYVINGMCDDWTSTGRIVMYEPNLIGIVKDFTVDGITIEEQNLINQTIGFSLRQSFVARNGYTLVSADYSQLELRILAHLSKDKKLLNVLNSGGDVFKSIASVWRSKPFEDISDDERQQSKQIVYGMIYGKGEKALAEDLEVSEEEAKDFMDSFIGTYDGVKRFISTTVEECRETKYVETLSGRRRYLPNICSSSSMHRSKAERQAINSTIQGSASDLVKTAMTALQSKLFDYKSLDIRFVLQMYDELMFEVKNESFQQFSRLLAECMENCLKNMRVELPVRVKVGPNWAQLQVIDPFE